MPIYEYVCSQCNRKFRKLVGVVAQSAPMECPRCQSADLKQQISRFGRLRGEEETMDAMANEMESMGDMDDPRAMKRLVQTMGSEMGEDMGDDFEQMMEEEGAAGPDAAPGDMPD